MKKISILFIVLVLVFVLSACGQQGMTEEVNDTSNTASYSTTQFVDEMYNENTFENADNQSAYNIQSDTTQETQKTTRKEWVVFGAEVVEGAVIERIDRDGNGNIRSIRWYDKCDICGQKGNHIGSITPSNHSDVNSSFLCFNCQKTRHTKIIVDKEWMDVEY